MLRRTEEDGAALIGPKEVSIPEVLPLQQRTFDDALLERLRVDEAAADQARRSTQLEREPIGPNGEQRDFIKFAQEDVMC